LFGGAISSVSTESFWIVSGWDTHGLEEAVMTLLQKALWMWGGMGFAEWVAARYSRTEDSAFVWCL